MTKTVKVGMMPGRIEEFAVETGNSLKSVIELAGLDATGYEVKVDGEKVTDLNAPITEFTNLILLVKQVKGNADKIVKIGMMPGRIEEFALTTSTTIAKAIEMAGLDATGYEVKVDGVKATDLYATITDNTNLILLVKQVKGNF